MPKDYRDRRIDNKPPRVITLQARQTTTQTDPEASDGDFGGDDISPILPRAYLRPGDGVLWFWRRATSEGAPTGRNVVLKTLSGAAVTHTYADLPGGWSGYVTSAAANYALQIDGITVATDETVYAIWDQFMEFTPGDYRLYFDTPDGAIDRILRLRNIDPDDPGALYTGMTQTPTWSVSYAGLAPEDKTDNFPRTLTTGTGVPRIFYALWQMSGLVAAPAAYYSAPSMTLLSYTYTDPTDPPAFNHTLITYFGETLSTTGSVEITAPFENGWGGAF